MKGSLTSLKLHDLIGGRTVWTEDLWDEALRYLLERLSTSQAMAMAELLNDDTARAPLLYKVDYLRLFRAYPPTVLLGAFDWQRQVRQHPPRRP